MRSKALTTRLVVMAAVVLVLAVLVFAAVQNS
ncbi:MAG: hypothetical protein QOE35_2382 [Actinomycetota bacterium]|jgi:hypothetical protein